MKDVSLVSIPIQLYADFFISNVLDVSDVADTCRAYHTIFNIASNLVIYSKTRGLDVPDVSNVEMTHLYQ